MEFMLGFNQDVNFARFSGHFCDQGVYDLAPCDRHFFEHSWGLSTCSWKVVTILNLPLLCNHPDLQQNFASCSQAGSKYG